jgi:deoxyadenosine/deoxycytidine kinase
LREECSAKTFCIFVERSLEACCTVFAQCLFDQGSISEEEFSLIEYSYQTMASLAPRLCKIEKTFYIDTPPELCLERIRARGRESERAITLQYLTDLHTVHEKQFGDGGEVIKIDGRKSPTEIVDVIWTSCKQTV